MSLEYQREWQSGVGIWNIMFYFPQMWLVINSQYEIEKVLIYNDK